MDTRFANKKVFITGASRGLGRAIAQAFRAQGAWVIGTHTGIGSPPDAVCQEWIAVDFSDLSQIKTCAAVVLQAEPDVLVNNAGINKIAPFIEITPEDFQAIQQVNVFTPFLLCQAAIPGMLRKGWGRIVNISSVWGKISKAHRASYSASKFALDGMTLALAAEHSSNGILANCIAPGFVDTELTQRVLGNAGIQTLISAVPVGRLAQADEVARLTLWLASEENTYLAGQNIAIDGGFSRV
ncbi:MAG: SDR family NAD(P)-dependent oxidoreductase [Undibacterium sp.]|uniref:SDR family NAD(P)-dependent oxidoreductase n=1 Tax=Undibacterium sp. TaxID=1914977 RepID=UPI00272444D5|nr:SDR family NAD(P)-dependent oxidoreductase [Undibacterium sp.]MDO8652917.1 SDR family NAD(P)-dependent oxidoreductase [Undibacterium sp.]